MQGGRMIDLQITCAPCLVVFASTCVSENSTKQLSLTPHRFDTGTRQHQKSTVAGAPTRRRRDGRRGEGGNRPHPYDAHPGTPRQPTPPSQAQSPCAPPPLHASPPSSPRGVALASRSSIPTVMMANSASICLSCVGRERAETQRQGLPRA